MEKRGICEDLSEEEEEEEKEELSRSEGGRGGGGRGRGRFSAFTLYFPFLSRSSKEIDVMGHAHQKKRGRRRVFFYPT